MGIDRRNFLALGGAGILGSQLSNRHPASAQSLGAAESAATAQGPAKWNAQWIWYPGQLAAYRHSRRVRLAMERCQFVGYPANFRQPQTEVYFRRSGTADRDLHLRWAAPVARVRTAIAGRGGDVTRREAGMRKGESGIEVHIDFSQSLPCLLLEGGAFATGADWEASLDGTTWVAAETDGSSSPETLPDAQREITIPLPVYRIAQPEGEPKPQYSLVSGQSLVLDFRETELGSLRFDVSGSGELTIQVGESIPEVLDSDPKSFEQYPLPPVRLSRQTANTTLPERAVRFARFTTTGRAELTNIRFDARLWPTKLSGHFESSDPDLNAIWTTAVATLRSNMHDFYLDGIRRDGLLWHDGPLALDAYERVFFDAGLSRQTLIAETMPPHPSIRDVGIIDSPMYDVIGFEREFLVRGDPAFSRMFRGRIEDILHFFENLQNDRGFVDAAKVEPYGFFPDWSATSQSGPDGHGTPAYGQMLLAAAFTAAARLARNAWQDEALAERYAAAAAKLKTSIRDVFWQPRQGLYANGFDRNGKLDSNATSFAQAFAVACDIANPNEYDSLFRFLNDESRRSAHYSLSQVVELTAYAKAGRTNEAVKRLKSAWLPIIQRGYHRFFEDIQGGKDPNLQLGMYGRKYAASLCHAWAGAAPVMAISLGILGIAPLEPGYRLCTVAPQPCGLKSVKGAVPTPHGVITLEWHGARGEVALPPGVSARLSDGRLVSGSARLKIS